MKIAYVTVQENIFMGNISFMGYPIYIYISLYDWLVRNMLSGKHFS